MGLVVKITSFLYRYLNGRDEKFSSKNRVPGGEIVLEGGVLGGDYCTTIPTATLEYRISVGV